MAVDLPENVAQNLITSSITGFQLGTEELRANAANAANIIRHSSARRFDELDIAESRSSSGLIATPIASPTTQAGP